jgi:hypothetical protein
MSTSGKTKSSQQPVLAANVPQILAELHQLATVSSRSSAAEKRGSRADGLAMVIRGK